MPLEEKVKNREFIVLGEFEPPKGVDFSQFLSNAGKVRGRIDALVIPEMANAVVKASSLGGCAYLRMHGFETVFQVCCRDRNRLALQADILAASALGISNIMVLPGEDIRYGDNPQARDVYDIDQMQLLETLEKFQSGKDMAGVELKGTPRFLVGSVLNAGAIGGALDIEINNLNKMVDMGVRFVITSPVFDLHRFKQVVKRVDTTRVALIPTVLLLKSVGMARYIDRNIKNISIPSEIIANIQKAPDRVRECIRITADLINGIKEIGLAGVMISTVGWEDRLPRVLDEARL